jgi:hypothetical protein
VKTDKVLEAQEARRAARKAMAEYESTRAAAARKKLLPPLQNGSAPWGP